MTDQHVWQVDFEVCDSVAQTTLTYHRLLANGTGIQFDEDPAGKLNLATGEDERLVMEGFLALIPDDEPLTCALRDRPEVFGPGLIYRYVFADSDKEAVAAALDGRLWNPDSSRDYVFIGGQPVAHRPATMKPFVKQLNKRPTGPTNLALRFEPALAMYRGVALTEGNVIRVIYGATDDITSRARQVLGEVASRYGYVVSE